MSTLALSLPPRRRDLGGFAVARILPSARRRMIGPFIFFDEMGPSHFAPGQGLDVRAHPHIGLATLTYLFEGRIRHRDTTGADQIIEPGAVNLMIAGQGVVHTERSPDADVAQGHRLHGLQLWLALPQAAETGPAAFHHVPDLPQHRDGPASVTLVLGQAFGCTSSVPFPHPALMLDIRFSGPGEIGLPDMAERALFTKADGVAVGETGLEPAALHLIEAGPARLRVAGPARVVLIGGAPYPEGRLIDWNFVASRADLIEAARADWIAAPDTGFRGRFPLPDGETDHIPYPGPKGQVHTAQDCPTS